MSDRWVREPLPTVENIKNPEMICKSCGVREGRVFKCLCGYEDILCRTCAKDHLLVCPKGYCAMCTYDFRKDDVIIICKICDGAVHQECFELHLDEHGIKVNSEEEMNKYIKEKILFKGYFERKKRRK